MLHLLSLSVDSIWHWAILVGPGHLRLMGWKILQKRKPVDVMDSFLHKLYTQEQDQ
jgi:hypothetical protein